MPEYEGTAEVLTGMAERAVLAAVAGPAIYAERRLPDAAVGAESFKAFQARAVTAHAGPVFAAAERQRLIEWMHAEAERLEAESGLPLQRGMHPQARENQAEAARALITAIAHISVYKGGLPS
jgi:hypothetical protein